VVIVAALSLSALACDDGPVPAAEYGKTVFADPSFSDSRFNSFSCATCHEESSAAFRLENTAFRESWWGGYAPRLIDAVDYCYQLFMRAAPLSPDDPRGRALYEYLVSISPERDLPTLPLSVVENVAPVPHGSATRGRDIYEAMCGVCHGDAHSGQDRLADTVPIIPEASIGFALERGYDPALVVIEKIRHGQFFGVGGNMPFYPLEVLSNADLGALLEHMGL
jgi:thiosulfate dehydrogenase